MSGDITAGDIQHDMVRALRVLQECTAATKATGRAAARALADYRRDHAQAVLRSEGKSADLRNAEADVECYAAMLHRNVTEKDAEACRIDAANVRAALSAYQSLLSSARVESDVDGIDPRQRMRGVS